MIVYDHSDFFVFDLSCRIVGLKVASSNYLLDLIWLQVAAIVYEDLLLVGEYAAQVPVFFKTQLCQYVVWVSLTIHFF